MKTANSLVKLESEKTNSKLCLTTKYIRSKRRKCSFLFGFDLMITFRIPIHSIFPVLKAKGRKGHRMKAILEWKINKHRNRIFMKPIFVTQTFQFKCRGSLYRRFPIYLFPFPIYFTSFVLTKAVSTERRERWHERMSNENYLKERILLWCVLLNRKRNGNKIFCVMTKPRKSINNPCWSFPRQNNVNRLDGFT